MGRARRPVACPVFGRDSRTFVVVVAHRLLVSLSMTDVLVCPLLVLSVGDRGCQVSLTSVRASVLFVKPEAVWGWPKSQEKMEVQGRGRSYGWDDVAPLRPPTVGDRDPFGRRKTTNKHAR